MTVLPAQAEGKPKATPPALEAQQNVEPKSADFVGALVIVGGGGFPDDIRERFLQLAGGKRGRLVVIPTASEKAERMHFFPSMKYWETQGLASVSLLHTLDPKQANEKSFVKPLTEATAAWLDGGDQMRLSKAYHGTAVERELRRLLARGGVIGGTSAGASIMSEIMIAGGETEASLGDGFGFLRHVVIDQHFQNRKRQNRLLGVLKKHRDCLGLGIDEETAVVVHGQTFKVLGKANVSLCLPPIAGEERRLTLLKSGEERNLFKISDSLMAQAKTPADGKPMAKRATAP